MDEALKYFKLQEKQLREWEAACLNCGACCGVYDKDPCEHLSQRPDGKYFCPIYENRLGEHKTKSGKIFKCVPIKNILDKSWPGDYRCAYKKAHRTPL